MCTGAEFMAMGSIAGGIGDFMSADDFADQKEREANQILANTKEELRVTAKAQSRRRGAQRTAYAKGGVKQTGTVKRVMEEQIREDELELLKAQHRGQIQIQETFAEAKEARSRGFSSLVSGLVTGAMQAGGLSG